MPKKEKKIKEDWEVPEVDLNLKHYSGHPSDVLKKIKHDIERYLIKEDIPLEKRQIYSAIYNAINYYKNISYLPSAEFSTNDTFLSHSIQYFNEDLKYLSEQYNSEEPVVSLNARIKSPIAFIDKVKEKINEYKDQGRDYRYFNESLRDLIGVRCIINPPAEIKAKGPQAESDFFYEVFHNLMTYRGIHEQVENQPKTKKYKFLPVNTRYDTRKLENLKARPGLEGFDEKLVTGENKITIVDSRPYYMEDPNIDSKVKDYHIWPKHSGYQSLHICVIPDFSYNMEFSDIPHYVIPPKKCLYAIEYQFRTHDEDRHAEYGVASHKESYKPDEVTSYHRLAVPFFISGDNPKITPNPNPTLRLRNFGESYEKFYGHSFKNKFNISFKDFRDIFGFQDRNDILAGHKIVRYDLKNDWYYLEDVPPMLFLPEEEKDILELMLEQSIDVDISYMLDEYSLTDNIIEISADPLSDNVSSKYKKPLPVNTYSVQSAEIKNPEEKSQTTPTSSDKSENDEHEL